MHMSRSRQGPMRQKEEERRLPTPSERLDNAAAAWPARPALPWSAHLHGGVLAAPDQHDGAPGGRCRHHPGNRGLGREGQLHFDADVKDDQRELVLAMLGNKVGGAGLFCCRGWPGVQDRVCRLECIALRLTLVIRDVCSCTYPVGSTSPTPTSRLVFTVHQCSPCSPPTPPLLARCCCSSARSFSDTATSPTTTSWPGPSQPSTPCAPCWAAASSAPLST